jgi:hypothetical protein
MERRLLNRLGEYSDKSKTKSIQEILYKQQELQSPEKEFKTGGGNSNLQEAKIVCLGEAHIAEEHRNAITKLINSIAKTNDIVLVEGMQSTEEEYYKLCRSTKTIKKQVKVFGWDNMTLLDKMHLQIKEWYPLSDQLRTLSDQSKEFHQGSQNLKAISEEFIALATERNKSMGDTIDYMIKKYPDKRIFVIAGMDHFTDGPILKEARLEDKSYIILIPLYEEPKEGLKEKTRKYYSNCLKD